MGVLVSSRLCQLRCSLVSNAHLATWRPCWQYLFLQKILGYICLLGKSSPQLCYTTKLFAVVVKKAMKRWREKKKKGGWLEEGQFSVFKRRDHLSHQTSLPCVGRAGEASAAALGRTALRELLTCICWDRCILFIREQPNEKINEERICQAGVDIVLQILACTFFICTNQRCVSRVPWEEGKKEYP